ncbi:hypothetical protein HY622_03590 [Candidatus Uhrbacteria bacterium]|nr:hypothetical protein [Candidatus Uhrbacteria bacterium]
MLTLITTYLRTQWRWRTGAIAVALLFIVAGVLFAPRPAEAAIPLLIGLGAAAGGALAAFIARDQMLSGLGWILSMVIDALNGLFINVVYLIIDVSRYTGFIDSIPVTRGWEIVRDVMNMFFVIVLLAIAVGTILQQEKYHYSKTLPKFIIAAIMINFSKTIAGIFIDFANVVMLTFTGAIENTAGGNFLAITGLHEFQNYVAQPGTSAVGVWETLLSLVILLAFTVIALIVVVVMLFILIFRIVALWFLVVLSPAAFFLSALPDDKGYAKKWWDQFVNYLIVGPIMLFFLWLSFTTLASSSGAGANNAPQIGRTISSVSPTATTPIPNKLGTAIGTPQTTLGFFLGIVMLLGSMAVAQQLGVEGGKMAGSVVQGAKDYVAGKKGPSPMRWARDRWSAYSKMREHERSEKAKQDLMLLAKPPAMIAAAGGALKDAAWRTFMTSERTKPAADFIRKSWDKIYTKPKQVIGEKLDRIMGDVQEEKNKAGEASQKAENNRERARRVLMKKEDIEAKQHLLKEQLEKLEEEPEDESPAEKARREKSIEYVKTLISELDDDKAITDPEERKRRAEEYRHKALEFDKESDKYKLAAQGKELQQVGWRALSAAPDIVLGVTKGLSAGLLAFAGAPIAPWAAGLGMMAPFAPDMADSMNGFGRRLMREVDDIQMEAIQASQKHFGGLRDEVVKAIANGAVKGYSKLEQMGAQREMIKRNLYTAEEVGVARRQFAERGARSAAMEAFDYDVFNKYPSVAYGMTAPQLALLLEKNRVNLKDLSRADAINGELLRAINHLGERLGNNVSAKYLSQMKGDPVVENRMQYEAMKETKRMRESLGNDFDASKPEMKDFIHMMKTIGLTRGYIDNPEFLNISSDGKFQGTDAEIAFNKAALEEAMKDDDIAPYFALTMHNAMMSHKDSEVMEIITKMLDPTISPAEGGNPMATQVAAALRNMSTALADRGKANMGNISEGVIATLEKPVFAEVLLESNPTIAAEIGITEDNVGSIQIDQERINQIKKDLKGEAKKKFREAMQNAMEDNSLWRRFRWGQDRF